MDLDEWEYLPDDAFLDFREVGEKNIFWGKRSSDPKTIFNMNYFICPSPNSRKINEPPGNSMMPSQLVTVPIHFESTGGTGKAQDDELHKDIAKVPIEISVVRSAVIPKKNIAPITGAMEADQDTVSQVFFKMKENEFVDMKMDSPRSGSRGFMAQIDSGSFQFEEKGEALESKTSPRMKVENEMAMSKKNTMDMDGDGSQEEVTWEENSGRLNIWKWSLTGIGAICSFGVAAATICILFFGNQPGDKQHQKKERLRFQIYTDDKRIKQQVGNQATKLNDALAAVRGVPMTRAHITCGGYYDGL
ncbi:uncharacterized protein LOC122279884 isoform X1 [Carya illinoinensis]|uniref:DUF6821 domain-containing protein n=1 Tax=Carya illinoinensis TaxID=32201 RepID=A0A8T1P852_CARIL|nr:uncharacterized protein LOC122279884 isoform X1 [Carya illinoinensis]KAG6637951.1 hypothetical protein CIPAW_10G001300 [Carya illinoinensis]KAG6690177.1 hypothetical protein I3842_10G001500 [Carya illinoinensis]